MGLSCEMVCLRGIVEGGGEGWGGEGKGGGGAVLAAPDVKQERYGPPSAVRLCQISLRLVLSCNPSMQSFHIEIQRRVNKDGTTINLSSCT